jgi:hypothetical protein
MIGAIPMKTKQSKKQTPPDPAGPNPQQASLLPSYDAVWGSDDDLAHPMTEDAIMEVLRATTVNWDSVLQVQGYDKRRLPELGAAILRNTEAISKASVEKFSISD